MVSLEWNYLQYAVFAAREMKTNKNKISVTLFMMDTRSAQILAFKEILYVSFIIVI